MKISEKSPDKPRLSGKKNSGGGGNGAEGCVSVRFRLDVHALSERTWRRQERKTGFYCSQQ